MSSDTFQVCDYLAMRTLKLHVRLQLELMESLSVKEKEESLYVAVPPPAAHGCAARQQLDDGVDEARVDLPVARDVPGSNQ